MKKLSKVVLSTLFFSSSVLASNNTSMFNGNTGIIETPNARIMPDWSMRMFLNQDQPFTYFGFTATPLPFLEANFHVTRISGVTGFGSNYGYGNYKDKSFNLKLLLQEETELLPSVVFGLDDFWGTALYSSKYVALGKEIGYFDFTLGYAKGRLGGEDISKYSSTSNSGGSDNSAVQFIKDTNWSGGKPFGSVVFKAHPKVNLLAEYSPIEYEKDRVNAFYDGASFDKAKSNINLGLKYFYSPNSTVSLAFTRGNNFAFGYAYQFGFSNDGMFDRLPDPKWKADEKKLKQYENISQDEFTAKLSNEVAAEKFKKVTSEISKNKIWIELENSRYNSDIKAAGRAISTVDEVAPKNYDTIYATLKQKDVPTKTFKVSRKEYDAFENEKVSSNYMKDALILSNSYEKMYKEFKEDTKETHKSDKLNIGGFNYNFGMSASSVLNRKEDPFAIKLGVKLDLEYDFGGGFFSSASLSHPLYNSIKDLPSDDDVTTNLSVNTQLLDYSKYDSTQLNHFTVGYMTKAPYESLARVELGYLDIAFAGVDLEWYKPLFDDRFGVGLQYQVAYKRYINNMVKIYGDTQYDAKFVNLYALVSPKYDIHMGLKIGEFMAGDRGFKIDLSRNYKEFSMGVFATFTNSDEVFTDEENKGYIDKGVYLKVPLEVFTFKNIKNILTYNLKPWTRDVGKFIESPNAIYPMSSSENNSQIMKKNIHRFKE
ncbi:membrane protein [Malaciobacter pacificus]|uniref:Uncharacterized protein n=1 Tax=Malaciobacter pacificus TaxID=1080223 RepID=A0A5C2HC53_9BACT|nr:YjbH domain-containing protein [Malaciobacter pacificus]QEP33862.1 hypothetical protein APAC_0718 [Malaciobacter pacificus]GGD34894.1 membrane protein [Malaciobacter pacificus]